MERMTSPEIGDALEEGRTTAVVGCGAIEQHGPHLPLHMDAEHADRLALEVATRLGDALVAPSIRVGCSEHHLAFPGTLSVRRDTFLAVCRDYVTSLARHGFRRICFVPTHGGNFAPLREGLPSLREAAGEACAVVAYTDLMAVIGIWREIAERESGLGDRVGGHADVAETSVLACLHPGVVRADRVARGYVPGPDEDRKALVERIIAEGFETVTPNGILGDARGWSWELGEALIAGLADAVAAALEEETAARRNGGARGENTGEGP